MKIYACDFETTTTAVSTTETRVYLWCVIDIFTEKEYYGEDIESFFNFVKENTYAKFYFHNLKFDGMFILDYILFHTDMEYDEETKKENSYSILMSEAGQFFSITLNFGKKRTKIQDSCKKFAAGTSIRSMASSFETKLEKLPYQYEVSEPTAVGYMYIRNDTLILARSLLYLYKMNAKKMTVGSDAYDRWKITQKDNSKTTGLSLFEIEELRNYYRGGYTYVNSAFINKELKNINGVCYDKNSMHPSSMYFNDFPCGKPLYFKGRYIENDIYPFHCQHIKCYFTLKKNKIPIVQYGFGKWASVYQREHLIGEKKDLYFVDFELKYFFECYDVYDVEYIDGFAFQKTTSPFGEYIDVFYKIKSESTGAKKQFAKLMLNSLYGKFGEKQEVIGKRPIDKNGVVGFEKTKPRLKKEQKYLPYAIWITAYSRVDLYDKILKCGGDGNDSSFLYCDTDSLHCINDDVKQFINEGRELGEWKLEYTFKKAKYIRAKCYYEENEDGKIVHIAGLPYDKIKDIELEEFNVGYKNSKLIPKIVKGGVLLVDIDYIIKERTK